MPNKIHNFSFVIFGDGFCARYLIFLLKKLNISFLVAIPTFSNYSNYIFNQSDLFKFNDTNCEGGGITSWGGAISSPTQGHFMYKNHRDSWSAIVLQALHAKKSIYLMNFFQNSPSFLSRVWRRLFLHWFKSDEFQIDTVGYVDNRYKSNKKNAFLPFSENSQVIRYDDVGFERRQETSEILISFSDSRTNLNAVTANKVIFAAGAVGNAWLVHKLTGKSKFKLGNHLATKIGTIHLRRPYLLSGLIQAGTKNERSFLVISLSERIRRTKYLSHSGLRLHPVKARSLRLEIKEALRNLLDKKSRQNFVFLFWVFVDSMFFLLTKNRLTYCLDMKLTLDIPPEYGRIEFIGSKLRRFEVELYPHADCLKEANDLLRRFLGTLRKHKSIGEISLVNKPSNFTENWLSGLKWEDAIHYYGTVPFVENVDGNLTDNSVDSNFQLRGFENVYVVGGSTIPIGHWGHPTYTILLICNLFANKIMNSKFTH